MEHISPQEAKRLIDEEGARLVDVREGYEWDEMRVKGSTLMPLSEYEGDPSQLPQADKTIFICAAGNRSQTAADIYEQAYSGAAAYNLEGGIKAWATQGLPTDFSPAE
ncbi:MAG TPA: rhodanese-like domain-containing protein [Solirubrobacterales bacterium]|jgi:rhodanese-related sulfurtransferase|nr:rhodanese-like domain-containing protein [Solirubrobacterales bacterium]